MLRSMFSAISGLRGHQVMMDVIGNNIANVNTVGFKTGRVNFQDILSQTFRGASAPQGGLGSINPAQVGLGMTVAGIDVLQTQGNLQSTGRLTDMAIQGDGFFVLSDGSRQYYTRDGAFDIGLDGELVNSASGLKVQGWVANQAGTIDTTTAVTDVVIPIGTRTTALPSSASALTGNLDASAVAGTTASTTLNVYDSLGVRHSIKVTFTKTGSNAWDWAATADAGGHRHHDDLHRHPDASQRRHVLGRDRLADQHRPHQRRHVAAVAAHRHGGDDAVRGHVRAQRHDRRLLLRHARDLHDRLRRRHHGRLQQRPDPAARPDRHGLVREPGRPPRARARTCSAPRPPRATPRSGCPGQGGRGIGHDRQSLEMSNVDLATQFTGMITAQRGFQANGRVITTSDEMLQELVNLKR